VLARLPFRVEVIQTDNGPEFGASFQWEDRQRPRAAALAQDPHDPLVQVDIVQGHADALGPAHPGVDQQQDDRGVAAAGEVSTLAGPE
jgi:hypothetical protein